MPVATLPAVTVGGLPLPVVAPGWGDLKITNRWPGGCWEASWTVPVRKLRRHRALVARQPVRIFYGGTPIWAGTLAEPNWDTGEMVALGLVRQAEETLCLDSGGLLSSTPDTIIDRAITAGALSWTRRASISSTAFASGTTDKINYLGALLDAYTKSVGTNWGVNARGEVYTATTATTPTWCVSPDSGVLGLADQTLVGTAVGRYISSPGVISTATAGTGTPEVGFDLTKLGVKSAANATAVLTSLRDKLQARAAWTNGLELTAPQITNTGGARANLACVWVNQMVRLQGVRDQRGLDAGTNFVIGETVWDIEDRTVQVSPMGLVDRTLAGLAEDAGVSVL